MACAIQEAREVVSALSLSLTEVCCIFGQDFDIDSLEEITCSGASCEDVMIYSASADALCHVEVDTMVEDLIVHSLVRGCRR